MLLVHAYEVPSLPARGGTSATAGRQERQVLKAERGWR